jgi:hypothetical protein
VDGSHVAVDGSHVAVDGSHVNVDAAQETLGGCGAGARE